MFTSIRRYHVKDKEELTRRAREDFLPKVKGLPGFGGYYVMHGDGDTWVSITVFETREGVEQSNRLAADTIREEHLEYLFEGEPEIIVGESVLQEMAYHEERKAA